MTGVSNPDVFTHNADVFAKKFNPNGDKLWSTTLGTSKADGADAISVDNFGNVYVAGGTDGSFSGRFYQANNAFLIKFRPVPEANTLLLSLFAFCYAARERRFTRRS